MRVIMLTLLQVVALAASVAAAEPGRSEPQQDAPIRAVIVTGVDWPGTGEDHPMAFAFEYGEGRVFHTTLGHDARAIRMPGAAELIRRGAAWVAAPSAVTPSSLSQGVASIVLTPSQ